MNLMPEEQAKKKWCCQPTLTREEPKCCASECMAWRWETQPSRRPDIDPGEHHRGFCGLAGPSREKE